MHVRWALLELNQCNIKIIDTTLNSEDMWSIWRRYKRSSSENTYIDLTSLIFLHFCIAIWNYCRVHVVNSLSISSCPPPPHLCLSSPRIVWASCWGSWMMLRRLFILSLVNSLESEMAKSFSNDPKEFNSIIFIKQSVNQTVNRSGVFIVDLPELF